jgi:hypothetical protein
LDLSILGSIGFNIVLDWVFLGLESPKDEKKFAKTFAGLLFSKPDLSRNVCDLSILEFII